MAIGQRPMAEDNLLWPRDNVILQFSWPQGAIRHCCMAIRNYPLAIGQCLMAIGLCPVKSKNVRWS